MSLPIRRPPELRPGRYVGRRTTATRADEMDKQKDQNVDRDRQAAPPTPKEDAGKRPRNREAGKPG